MYVSHKHKTVFIALAKNASRTTAAWLRTLGFYACSKHHSLIANKMEPSNVIKNYFVFAIVRNPYERFVSGWFAWHKRHPTHAPFSKYLADLERVKPTLVNNNTKYLVSQCHVLKLTKKMFTKNISIVRFENLQNGLRKLPFVDSQVMLGKEGSAKAVYGKWRSYFDKQSADKVYNIYKDDFQRFKYKRNSYKCPQ